MLKKAQESSLFRFPQTPSREKLKEIVVSLAKKEVEECTGTPQEVKRCERAVGATKELPFDSIVVHGVHQFTPVQLHLLLAMEKMGITIIFLFNYQKKYSKIYSSWNDIYGCFEVPIHHDTVVREYTPPTMQNPSNALACALGEICEDRNAVGSGMLRKWYKLYKSVQLMEFANITEYAHFVSNHFDAAIQRYSESRSVMERGNDVWSNAAVLRHLDEQVYTANRDVHTLLKIYYPEYAKDRHFLSYPIGQFFSAIYRLWDYENSKIIFDVNAIKECLSSNILSVAPGEVLLRTFYNVEILFENVTTDVLSDDDSLAAALTEPRAREYEAQMAGYRIMSKLVSSPKSLCWGRVFRYLFPLSREVCNGCPADPEGRITSDDTYKLRMNPNIKLPPARPSRRLDRNMGSFNEMIISRPSNGPCSAEEVAVIAEKASQNGIGALVVPNRLASQIVYDGILLNYDEFYYAVAHCPYFFAKGVVCIFDGDTGTNFSLYKNLGKLDTYGYRKVLYCNENTVVANGGKIIREYSDGYHISIQKF